jgi:hypothetical protein
VCLSGVVVLWGRMRRAALRGLELYGTAATVGRRRGTVGTRIRGGRRKRSGRVRLDPTAEIEAAGGLPGKLAVEVCINGIEMSATPGRTCQWPARLISALR